METEGTILTKASADDLRSEIDPITENDVRVIKIDPKITQISATACEEIKGLEEVIIPRNVNLLDTGSFRNCPNLKQVGFSEDVNHPSSLKEIGDKAFERCIKLNTFKVPKNVSSIGDGAFQGCKALTSIQLSEEISEIKPNTFLSCENLKEINIPQKVEKIQKRAFLNCSKLEKVHIAKDSSVLKEIGEEAFKSCKELTELQIPKTVTTIGKSAFEECSKLTRIEIPEGTKEVNDFAFKNCNKLNYLKIPSDVKLGEQITEGCNHLKTVEISGTNAIEFLLNCKKVDRVIVDERYLGQIKEALNTKLEKNPNLTIISKETINHKKYYCMRALNEIHKQLGDLENEMKAIKKISPTAEAAAKQTLTQFQAAANIYKRWAEDIYEFDFRRAENVFKKNISEALESNLSNLKENPQQAALFTTKKNSLLDVFKNFGRLVLGFFVKAKSVAPKNLQEILSKAKDELDKTAGDVTEQAENGSSNKHRP